MTSIAPTVWNAAGELGLLLLRVVGYAVVGGVFLYVTAVLVWLVWDLVATSLSQVGHRLRIPVLIAVAGESRSFDVEESESHRRQECLTSLDLDPALLGIGDVHRILRLARRAEPETFERCYRALAERRFPDEDAPRRRRNSLSGVRETWVRWRIERWLTARSW